MLVTMSVADDAPQPKLACCGAVNDCFTLFSVYFVPRNQLVHTRCWLFLAFLFCPVSLRRLLGSRSHFPLILLEVVDWLDCRTESKLFVIIPPRPSLFV